MTNIDSTIKFAESINDFMLMCVNIVLDESMSPEEAVNYAFILNPSFAAIFDHTVVIKNKLREHILKGINLTVKDIENGMPENSGWVTEWSEDLLKISLKIGIEHFEKIPLN